MIKCYGYEIIEKETQVRAGDDRGLYFYTGFAAMKDAEIYIEDSLIPNKYKGKTLDDFEIIIQDIIR